MRSSRPPVDLKNFRYAIEDQTTRKTCGVKSVEAELFGGVLGHFVDMVDHGFSMISAEFAEKTQGEWVTGFSIRDVVTISLNQCGVRNPGCDYSRSLATADLAIGTRLTVVRTHVHIVVSST